MVLFKRKAIDFFPPPETPEDPEATVWYVPETQEWFTEYDDYLKRLDYYNTRKFVCETTGITGYTFWEALEIETQEIKKIEKLFPEPCKEPILRYVQFSMIQRIDQLIDDIYYKFKSDFFPGDQVNIKVAGQPFRDKGVVKEKARFNAITLPNGEQRKAYCQYRVLITSSDREITCDEIDLSRDRLAFTKAFIRGFIKLALIKSPRVGSPWVVKDSYAKKYRISADYPPHLAIFKEDLQSLPIDKKRQHDNLHVNLQPLFALPQNKRRRVEEADNEASLRKFPFAFVSETVPSNPADFNEWRQTWLNVLSGLVVFIDESHFKPTDQDQKEKVITLFNSVSATVIFAFNPEKTNLIVTKRTYSPKFNYQANDYFHDLSELSRKVWSPDKVLRFFKSLEFNFNENELVIPNVTIDKNIKLRPLAPLEAFLKIPTQAALKQQSINNHLVPLYPIGATADQLKEIQKFQQLQISRASTNSPRPPLVPSQPKKPPLVEDLRLPFQLTNDVQKPNWRKLENDQITRVSELLESWCFLNIYRKALCLDNFTLDDYITAISWSRQDIECQLVTEIFCAALKCILNDDVKVGGNNTHGISKDENGVGDGEQYLILIPRKGGYVVERAASAKEPTDTIKKENGVENGNNVKEESEEDEDDKPNTMDIKAEEPPENGEDENEEQEDQQDDVAEDEEDEITNNAHKFFFYKKKTWQERLRKRNFTDGQWLIILVGVLSLVEHVPRYSQTIHEFFDYIAPLDSAATTNTLEDQFFRELPVDLRISVVTILCEMLTSGVVIRNFIDKSLEDSTQLRKERIEIVREYKNFMEQASNLNKECRDAVIAKAKLIKVEKKPIDPSALKRLKGGRSPALRDAPTDEELALAKIDKEFAKKLDERVKLLEQASQIKVRRKEIEFELNELDLQRVNYVGRDRLYNRYWWFESNGLPTIGSAKKISEEDDDEAKDDAEPADESFEEEEDGIKDETYLVGRLFVQGPSNDDRLNFLGISDDLLEKWNSADSKSEDDIADDLANEFERKCNNIFGFQFENNVIKSKDDKVLVDEYGATSVNFVSTAERKFIEEKPNPLLHRDDWRFIDTPEDLSKFIAVLNKTGEREGQLLKELESLKEGIKLSMESRIKALGLEKKSSDEEKLEEKIAAIEISDIEEDDELNNYDEADEEEVEDVVLPDASSQESDFEVPKPEYDEPEEEDEDDYEDGIVTTRKRRTRLRGRRVSKRLSANNHSAVRKPELRTRSQRNGHLLQELPVSKPKPSKQAAAIKSKRQRIKAHHEKVAQKERLINALENLRNNRNEVRCLEWVNSSCINETGATHYEGVKETKHRGGRKKKI